MERRRQAGEDVPLQIIRSRILVLPIRAERTHVPRRLVHEAVSDHLVLPLEAFAAFRAGAVANGTVVRAVRRMNVCVRAGQNALIVAGGKKYVHCCHERMEGRRHT